MTIASAVHDLSVAASGCHGEVSKSTDGLFHAEGGIRGAY
jgi:hypothetical protein